MFKKDIRPKKSGSRAQNDTKGRTSVFDILFGNTLSKARGIIISCVIARTF